MAKKKSEGINFFQKYLTIWVFICMVVGVIIGKLLPAIPNALGNLEISGISIPIAILIWIMIYPMMLKVDFQSIKQVGKNPKGLFITYVTGAVIKELREKNNVTQLQLADKLGVSDKTISKWETGKGYPDITLLDPIANVLSVSVAELISGNTVYNSNISANMLRSQFYVCPVCGNVIHGMGESVIHCHGVLLQPEEAEETDENHKIFIEHVEDEYYVQIRHEMTKDHYISFIAAVSSDRMQMVKLYPEGDAQARFKINGVKKIYFYCNRSGLFSVTLLKN